MQNKKKRDNVQESTISVDRVLPFAQIFRAREKGKNYDTLLFLSQYIEFIKFQGSFFPFVRSAVFFLGVPIHVMYVWLSRYVRAQSPKSYG